MNQNTKPVFAIKAAAALCVGLAASSSTWAETPLGLMLSETLTYDTNILKDNANKRSDLVSSTGVKATFDKDYGRQNYRASVLGVFQRYRNLKDYDNDGYELNLGLSSQIASNGLIDIDHSRNRTQQELSEQGTVRYKEVLDSASTVISGRYGLYGRWGLTGLLSDDSVSYDVNRTLDQKTRGARVGLRYSPSDLLYFDVGVKKSKAELENYPVYYVATLPNGLPVGLSTIGDKLDRYDLNVISGWTVTGYSQLQAQFGWTREKHEIETERDFSGWTGRATWNYTPRGKVAYSLGLVRDTNNAGGLLRPERDFGGVYEVRELAQRRLTTSIQGSATWSATAKISANLNFSLSRLEDERTDVELREVRRASGNYRSISMGLVYKPTRSLTFSCDLKSYKRDTTTLAIGYDGESVACTAGFVID